MENAEELQRQTVEIRKDIVLVSNQIRKFKPELDQPETAELFRQHLGQTEIAGCAYWNDSILYNLDNYKFQTEFREFAKTIDILLLADYIELKDQKENLIIELIKCENEIAEGTK